MKQMIRLNMCMLLACVSAYGYSNPIEGGSTETVSNTWNVAVPWLMVGSNSGSNTLEIVDGGTVNNQIGYLGNTPVSTHNQAIVTGSGVWNNTIELSVGYGGADNTLTVADGGTVITPNAYIGNFSSRNQTVVTGTGSLLDAGVLNVGHQGDENSLLVADGGRVDSVSGTIGYWIGSDNNTATVDGPGSVWSNANALTVGDYGTGNQLLVTNSGLVHSPVLNVGARLTASNNTVSVDGAWLDAPELYIGGTASGAGGIGNLVQVQNGGTVSIESLNIYSGNSFDLNDGGRLFVSTNFNASTAGFNFNAGGTLEVGGELSGMTTSIDDHRTLILNGTNALWANMGFGVGGESGGGSLIVTNGGQVISESGVTIGGGLGSNNVVVVDGDGSYLETWRLRVGDTYPRPGPSKNDRLEILNGGYVNVNQEIQITGNDVLVSGTNSTLNIADFYTYSDIVIIPMTIQDGGALTIINGGLVSTPDLVVAGSYWNATSPAATNDRVVVSGPGSTLEIRRRIPPPNFDEESGDLLLGANHSEILVENSGLISVVDNIVFGGSSNRLSIVGGGVVTNRSAYIGATSGANDNTVLVSGSGSVWQNHEGLYLGMGQNPLFPTNLIDGGTGNSLTVQNGGLVLVGDVDTNSLPSISRGGIIVGDTNGAEMVVASGSLVKASDFASASHNVDLWIGLGSNDVGSVLIAGSNTLWKGWNYVVGNDGSGNTLTIADGGRAESKRYMYVGANEGADNNRIDVTGEGSLLDAPWIYVGSSGSSGNSLEITDGGEVSASSVSVTDMDENSHNRILVSGAGSHLSGRVYLGRLEGIAGSPNNALVITDGGRVDSLFVQLEGSSAVVSGPGSIWNATPLGGTTDAVWPPSFQLWGNSTLTIENGGVVSMREIELGGPGVTSSSNLVVVSGAGSLLELRGDSPIAYSPPFAIKGSSNTMRIEDGGQVSVLSGDSEIYGEFNNVVVTGPGSVWSNSGNFYLGGYYVGTNWVNGGTGNSLTVEGGGLVLVGDVDAGALSAIDGGLVVGDADGSTLVVANGSRVESEGGYIGNATGEHGLVLVTDDGSEWLVAEDLQIGREGAMNVLAIENGGLVQNDVGYLGRYTDADGNSVSVTGAGSEWNSRDSLYLGGAMNGTWADGGTGSMLYAADGGLVSVGDDLHNRNISTIDLDPGGVMTVGGDYYQDTSSLLRFGVDTNASGAPVNALMTVGGTAEFEEGAQILYASNVGQLDFDRFYTNKLVEADLLVVAGITNANSLDLEKLDASGSLVDVIFWENDQDIYALAGRKYLADSAGFADGTMMARLAKEIDDLSLLGDANANKMIYLLNTMSGSQQNAQLTQQYERGTPNQLHIQGMTEGLGELSKRISRRPAQEPEGAAGPHRPDQGPRGWVRSYGSWGDYAAKGVFAGYDHNVYGTLVGIDWLQRSDILFGVAGGYARSVIDQTDGDRSEAETGYGVVYVSMGTEAWYGDLNVAFGRSSIEDQSGAAFGTSADYTAGNFALYLGGGREFWFGSDRFSLTPEASMLLTSYQQDDYVESGVMPRQVEAYSRESAISGLGATLAMQQDFESMILKPELRARWLHEFNADTETVNYSLVNGAGEYHFLMPAAEVNIIETGAGLTGRFSEEWSLMLDVDWRFGEDYDAYAVGGRLIYEF